MLFLIVVLITQCEEGVYGRENYSCLFIEHDPQKPVRKPFSIKVCIAFKGVKKPGNVTQVTFPQSYSFLIPSLSLARI